MYFKIEFYLIKLLFMVILIAINYFLSSALNFSLQPLIILEVIFSI